MSADPEFDEETLAIVTQRAAELGFDSPEEYVRHLLERHASDVEAVAYHAKMRALIAGGEGDCSAN